jgi:CRP/FNR family cyclic AMP-dependent transcriptional regulator
MRKALFFLGVLNDGDLDWLIAQGNKADIAAGSVLIHQGQPIDTIFIILDGLFSVSTASAPGERPRYWRRSPAAGRRASGQQNHGRLDLR